MISNWVVTRAQPDADADAKALRALGLTALTVPCIERVALSWPAWHPGAARQVILVSSPFAAIQLALAWPALRHPRPAVAAMAPITTERLAQQHVPVAIAAEGGVVALARAVLTWHQQHPGPLAVLYPTSDAGLRQPEQDEAVALLATCAEVERAAVYSTRAPRGLDAQLAAVPAGHGYVFMSPSAVENVLASFARAGQTHFAAAVACIGQSTQRRCLQLAAHLAPAHHVSFSAFAGALAREKPS